MGHTVPDDPDLPHVSVRAAFAQVAAVPAESRASYVPAEGNAAAIDGSAVMQRG